MPTAFVTGGAGGAGRAICEGFARRGLNVAVVDREAARAHAVASDMEKRYPVRCAPIVRDITQPGAVESAWDEAGDRLGNIGVLVNNAGRFQRSDLAALNRDAWNKTLDLNLTAPFTACQKAIGHWMERKMPGAIVNVASNSTSIAGFGGAYDYAASKAGLVGLSIQLAVDFGPYGIRTNVVSPGSFRSYMSQARLSQPGAEEQSAALVPLRRIGEPEDIAAVVVFLALDGMYVNGEQVRCDGGTTVWALRPVQGTAT